MRFEAQVQLNNRHLCRLEYIVQNASDFYNQLVTPKNRQIIVHYDID
jgi:hypothetical protein